MHEILGFMGENAFEILGNLFDLLLAVSDGPSRRSTGRAKPVPGRPRPSDFGLI
jgi:hypothetical protein